MGASDSSGGRALHSKGRAREDEPVQARAHLVSALRLPHPFLPLSPRPAHPSPQRRESEGSRPLRSSPGLLARGWQDASPFNPDHASELICS